ncbi:hypothetical protein KJ359_013031 [Pestalotiopsis sp. 9143b]|nr:hypothetical protein KJ359_013031 [Pestalotiopsis sp. 9143b]
MSVCRQKTSNAAMSTSSLSLSHDDRKGDEKDDDTNHESPPETFSKFGQLPVELRLMILQERLDSELAPPLRTLIIADEEPHILTQGATSQLSGLWHTGNRLLRGEIERRSTLLPARLLTDAGLNCYYINRGLTKTTAEQHHGIGLRPVPDGAVIFAGLATVLRLCSAGDVLRPERRRLEWLSGLLVDHYTFRALLRQRAEDELFYPPPSEDGGSSQQPPFHFAPNLRMLYLGFGRRLGDVVMMEARCAGTALLPVRVLEQDSDDDSDHGPSGLVVDEGEELHGGLEAMIELAARESLPDVRELEACGVEVRWVVIRDEAMVRRDDLIIGYDAM